MGMANAKDTLPPGRALQGTVLLLPVTPNPECVEYPWCDLPQLLLPRQYLVISLEECSLTLRQGRGVLAQAFLRPLAFRVFLALLVALRQGRSSSFAELLALKEATEDQIALLLKSAEARLAWLEEGTDVQRKLLQQRDENERKIVLKPLRRAIRDQGGLGPVLFARRFPWVVKNRYGKGYWLARLHYRMDRGS